MPIKTFQCTWTVVGYLGCRGVAEYLLILHSLLRLAPQIFKAVSDALECVVQYNGVQRVFHYLDDFLVIGAPGSSECAQGHSTLLSSTNWLGLPTCGARKG